MQLDMHYYGTYAMAIAAGMKPEAAQIVATAAQYVDDNAHKESLELEDGARIDSQATAHHALDINNLDPEDQRNVWIPFHFLPGNQGEEYTERLICQMDSEIAREMVKHNTDLAATADFGLELLGITAHVYEDTFSHYGFSGVSSRRNRVVNDSFEFEQLDPDIRSYIEEKAKRFFDKNGEQGGVFENIKRWLITSAAENLSAALGHGAVATYPDRPYLQWSYETEYPQEKRVPLRNNPATFLQGCRSIHAMLRRYLDSRPEHDSGQGMEFGQIEDKVKWILRVQADKQGRIRAWQNAASEGRLMEGQPFTIPEYQPWSEQWKSLEQLERSDKALEFSLYRFFQAASLHRNYVLRQLLPAQGLVIK